MLWAFDKIDAGCIFVVHSAQLFQCWGGVDGGGKSLPQPHQHRVRLAWATHVERVQQLTIEGEAVTLLDIAVGHIAQLVGALVLGEPSSCPSRVTNTSNAV